MNKETLYQLTHSICSMQELADIIELSNDEKEMYNRKIRITPYILRIIEDGNLHVRKQFIPFGSQKVSSFEADYLQEVLYSPVENLVHRYKSKAIYIATNQCACYCQFCTRQRVTQCSQPYKENLNQVIEYCTIIKK